MNNYDSDLAKKVFEKEKEHHKSENQRARELVELNEYLKSFNWALIHPYLSGGHIFFLKELQRTNTGSNAEIFRVFASSFFDLKSTAVFIDGYFKQRPCLELFCPLIDQSVIMCLQKDYAGAINTLIPVIEGCMRHYLVNVIKKQNESIMKSEDLFKVFHYIKSNHLKNVTLYYKTQYAKQPGGTVLDTNQIAQLVKYKGEYLDLWFEIIQSYFKENLYLNTRGEPVQDKLNRHSIFHGFNGDIYYSLENYLKVYSCLHYLAWAFTFAYDNISILATINQEEAFYKWRAFEKIKLISAITTPIKSSIYAKHPGFDNNEFERDLFRSEMDNILAKVPSFGIEHKLRFLDRSIPDSCYRNTSNNKPQKNKLLIWVLKKLMGLK